MSAESNLAGLYPPVAAWQPGLVWQPIPVHTIPEKMDNVSNIKKVCPILVSAKFLSLPN
jgi:lysosomal acid phosphatase